MSLTDYFDLPADVLSEFSKGITNWMNHVRIAVNRGIDDVFELTDIVFFLHHPERMGRKIESWEKDAIKTWNVIRKTILDEFPSLRNITSPPKLSKEELEAKLDGYIRLIQHSIVFAKPEVMQALMHIRDKDRYLFAIFRYVRFHHRHPKEFHEFWAWDQDEIDDYKKSLEHAQALKAIKQVKRAFSADPEMKQKHYKLVGRPHARSLKEQYDTWNKPKNKGVKAAGQKLRKILLKEMKKAIYPNPPDMTGLHQLHKRLTVDWQPGTLKVQNLAVPGMSPHGRMRAVDFCVKLADGSNTIVANTGGADYWRKQGYDSALRNAVKQANKALGRTAFKGPLSVPDEPWHYTYIP